MTFKRHAIINNILCIAVLIVTQTVNLANIYRACRVVMWIGTSSIVDSILISILRTSSSCCDGSFRMLEEHASSNEGLYGRNRFGVLLFLHSNQKSKYRVQAIPPHTYCTNLIDGDMHREQIEDRSGWRTTSAETCNDQR